MYDFRVRAVNVRGAGPPSNSVSKAPSGPPGAPTGLSAAAGDGQVTLSWDAPSSDGGSLITGYQYSQDSGSWTSIPSSRPGQANAGGYTVTGLTNGRTYSFQIRAVNGIGGGLPSNSASAVPERPQALGPPGAPTGLSAMAGDGLVTLSWDAPSSDGGSLITGYQY
ncbi:MAG: fibronectin type III domain-containing protein, partial [bacterium]|nr:fibronectin type III domain-containing protein [bacterium]